MVVTDDSRYGTGDKIESGDDLFGATDAGSTGSTKRSDRQVQYQIEIDTVELFDSVIKSVAGGVATGLVMNNLMGDD